MPPLICKGNLLMSSSAGNYIYNSHVRDDSSDKGVSLANAYIYTSLIYVASHLCSCKHAAGHLQTLRHAYVCNNYKQLLIMSVGVSLQVCQILFCFALFCFQISIGSAFISSLIFTSPNHFDARHWFLLKAATLWMMGHFLLIKLGS